jgi:small membrane protein
MNLFQGLVLALFVVLAFLTLSAGMRGAIRKRIVAFWLSVWLLGATAIVWPHSTMLAAHALGIGRGADLLLYSSVLIMFVAFFYVYARFRRLERQITLLVRRLAIQHVAKATPDASTHSPQPKAAPRPGAS